MVSRSSARRWWTISSAETVSAPWSPRAFTKALLPEARGPVTAIVTGPLLGSLFRLAAATRVPPGPGPSARRRRRSAGRRRPGRANRAAARNRGGTCPHGADGRPAHRGRRALHAAPPTALPGRYAPHAPPSSDEARARGGDAWHPRL